MTENTHASPVYEEVFALCRKAKESRHAVAALSPQQKNRLLQNMAEALTKRASEILSANRKDLENAAAMGVPPTMMDRLSLNLQRIKDMAEGIRTVVSLKDPTGLTHLTVRPSGITVKEMRVPLGVVAIIYEARPNVTADAAALALKAGNAVVLRGGKEAISTNRAIVKALREALRGEGLPAEAVSLVENTARESADALMEMRGLIDVLIPRGGKGLIQHCVAHAKVPVIETGAGNCHVYVDKDADLNKALAVAVNAKCSRPSVCNAAESLLLHRDIAKAFLPRFYDATRFCNLALRGTPEVLALLPAEGVSLATEEDFYTEYNDFILSVAIVDSAEEAIRHINRTGTGHSEAILTENDETAALFFQKVDAAALYRNASTRFTDGGEWGLGAEIGISTQKLHARGPMGLAALTTVKYLVEGDGAVRL